LIFSKAKSTGGFNELAGGDQLGCCAVTAVGVDTFDSICFVIEQVISVELIERKCRELTSFL
jgi:hypothetical protein